MATALIAHQRLRASAPWPDLHDGHLHRPHEDHVDGHAIAINAAIPCSARRKPAVRKSMGRPADTKRIHPIVSEAVRCSKNAIG
jgi:hypothetical protein